VITADPTGLQAGTYTGTITLSCVPASACTADLQIQVLFTLNGIVLTAAPDPVNITLIQGNAQSTDITLTGTATVLANVPTVLPWLFSPVSISSPGTLSLLIATAGLAVGTYSGSIVLQCDAANGSAPCLPVVLAINLTVTSAPQAPTITANGIVPVFSNATTIQSGEWVSIYGGNLASALAQWNGQFPIPTSLGGTSVTVNGKPAPLWFVSPGQINLQAPDDTATGSVPVVVSTQSGNATALVTLGPFAPSFSLLDAKHVAAIIIRQDGSGSHGNGAYDVLGPTGSSLGYATVAAKQGDIVVLFGVGFGPTNPSVPAGQPPAGNAPASNIPSVTIGGINAQAAWAGIVAAGLFQINITVPAGVPSGDQALIAMAGGVQTQSNVVFAIQ
jgi:uncharacterized protein (TIGR03437 family)